MFSTFWDLISEAKKFPKIKLCVAPADDEAVLLAVKDAVSEGFVEPVLVGDADKIWNISVKISLDLSGIEIIDESNPIEATHLAVRIVGGDQADVLMKGMVNSSDFLRAVIRPEYGLAEGNILSHLAIFEISGFNRLIFKTDGGLNISPNLDQKKQITVNAVEFMRTIGIDTPGVAVLSPALVSGGKLDSAVDAQELKAMAERGQIMGAFVEGPIDLGPAVDSREAKLLGIEGPVAGRADLLVVPNIEVGNILGKTIIHFAGGKMAGLVVGARKPIVLTSRAESAFGKLSSVSFACYYMMKYKAGSV